VLAGVVLLGVMIGPDFASASGGVTACSSPGSCSVTFTGAGEYVFTVPAGVSDIEVQAQGGRGGSGWGGKGNGGSGGFVDASVPVSAGQVLYAEVAGNGGDGTPTTGGQAGANGGATGGDISPGFDNDGGGGGGGASDLRTVPVADPALVSLDSRLVVAGGGGGGGANDSAPRGGFGTGGGGGLGEGPVGGGGGGAATGGTAGTGGTSGTLGSGGAGGLAWNGAVAHADLSGGAGGGGGGGLYGGGGGGASPSATAIGSGGGGGSSFVPAGNVTGAVPDGQAAFVTIIYATPVAGVSGPLTFAAQPEETVSPQQVVTVTNNAAASVPLVVGSLTFSGGTGPGDYLIASNGCGSPLAPGASCQIAVSFAPQASSGTRATTLDIATNDPDTPDATTVNLSGTAGALPTGATGATGASGASGAKGTTGSSGATGASGASGSAGVSGLSALAGPAGPQGATGPQGPAGEIDLVTCTNVKKKVKGKTVTQKKCSTQLTSSPESFTASLASATLSRAGHVYATGSVSAGTLKLHASKALRAGHYTLKLTTGSGKNRHTTTESVTVGETITVT
jgi:Glycine rich protein